MTTGTGLLAVALATVRGQKADRQTIPIPLLLYTHTISNYLLYVPESLCVLETIKDQVGVSAVRCLLNQKKKKIGTNYVPLTICFERALSVKLPVFEKST